MGARRAALCKRPCATLALPEIQRHAVACNHLWHKPARALSLRIADHADAGQLQGIVESCPGPKEQKQASKQGPNMLRSKRIGLAKCCGPQDVLLCRSWAHTLTRWAVFFRDTVYGRAGLNVPSLNPRPEQKA